MELLTYAPATPSHQGVDIGWRRGGGNGEVTWCGKRVFAIDSTAFTIAQQNLWVVKMKVDA